MRLSHLCQGVTEVPAAHDVEITGLTMDSRYVKPGNVFLACPGSIADGHEFIDVAIQKGASAVLCEASKHIFNEAFLITDDGREVPIIAVPHLLVHLGHLAAMFYQDPSAKLTVFGVTGTNGKTSVTQYLAACLTELGKKCAVVGTVGNGFLPQLLPSTHTTPNPLALQDLLTQFLQQGAQAIAMEVSSHGLDQSRVNGVHFDTAVFTNLSHDHLDYHHTMENYGNAKRKLFQMPNLKRAIFNFDDIFGRGLYAEFAGQYSCYAYSVNPDPVQIDNLPMISASNIILTDHGISADINSPWGQGKLQTPLFGLFNLSNILAVITCLGSQGFALPLILEVVAQVHGVKGRMQLVQKTGHPKVVIDYAHTPDALEKALKAIRSHISAKIWCVFGCGGDRDTSKRPEMGQIAEQYADHIIITNDNPRHEEPEAIAEQIMAGISAPDKVQMILDRAQAICYAIKHAAEKDVILIAGKGHEQYQQFGDEKIDFSDEKIVLDVFGK